MTRGVIKSTARKKLGESTAVFFTNDDIEQWINDSLIDIVWQTRCYRARVYATTTADTLRYTLTTLIPNTLRINQVRIYSDELLQWRRLDQKDYDFLDKVYPYWVSNDAADPLYYVYDRELNEFILFPKCPDDYVGANYLEVYHSPMPTPLTDDNQTTTDVPEQLHPAIIEYVVATGLEGRGYQDIADNHWLKYQGKLNSYMAQRELEEDEEICMHGER
jgi:hypothetical protein